MKHNTKIIAGVSLLVMLCVWAAVAWEVQNVLNGVSTVNDLRQQIMSAQSQAETTASLRKTFLGVGEDPHIFDQYFVSATDTPTFIGNIESLAQSQSLVVSIGSVNISSPSSGKELDMTLSVIGSWGNVLRFVHLLELLPYSTKLSNVNIAAADTGTNKSSVQNFRADIQFSVAAN